MYIYVSPNYIQHILIDYVSPNYIQHMLIDHISPKYIAKINKDKY